jgi:putative phosphoesterase
MTESTIRIGVISDTHGHMPADLGTAFGPVERIVHAGDIDHPSVLDELRKIAPVTAVRGNMDGGSWAERLPRGDMFQVGAVTLYALHILGRMDIDPVAARVGAVICGHTHQPLNEERGGILYFNPGSACFPRYGSPASVGVLEIDAERVRGRLIEL